MPLSQSSFILSVYTADSHQHSYDQTYFAGVDRRSRNQQATAQPNQGAAWTPDGIVAALQNLLGGAADADPETQAAIQEQIAILAEQTRARGGIGAFPGDERHGDSDEEDDGQEGDEQAAGLIQRLQGLFARQ